MKIYDQVEAVFRPNNVDDLRDEIRQHVGQKFTWRASWVIEDGPYAGQWAMVPDNYLGFWAPECDLSLS